MTKPTISHSVGSEIEGLRIPEKFEGNISKINELLEDSANKRLVIETIVGIISTAETTSIGDSEYHDGGVLSTDRANFDKRFQPDLHKVRTICAAMRDLGHNIALTSGTFDIIHIGHAQYLEAASRYGDFLVVGVDSDEKVRNTKGPSRPVVTENERLRMLAHLRCVDLLTLKEPGDTKWQLISVVQPDTLVATEGTYTEEQIAVLESGYVKRVVVLPPQATTSTTARLRKMQIGQSDLLKKRIASSIESELGEYFDDQQISLIRSVVDKSFSDD